MTLSALSTSSNNAWSEALGQNTGKATGRLPGDTIPEGCVGISQAEKPEGILKFKDKFKTTALRLNLSPSEAEAKGGIRWGGDERVASEEARAATSTWAASGSLLRPPLAQLAPRPPLGPPGQEPCSFSQWTCFSLLDCPSPEMERDYAGVYFSLT